MQCLWSRTYSPWDLQYALNTSLPLSMHTWRTLKSLQDSEWCLGCLLLWSPFSPIRSGSRSDISMNATNLILFGNCDKTSGCPIPMLTNEASVLLWVWVERLPALASTCLRCSDWHHHLLQWMIDDGNTYIFERIYSAERQCTLFSKRI